MKKTAVSGLTELHGDFGLRVAGAGLPNPLGEETRPYRKILGKNLGFQFDSEN